MALDGHVFGSIMDSGIDVGLSDFNTDVSYVAESSLSSRNHDPLLLQQGRISPIDFGKYHPDAVAAIDFTSPAKMFIEDSLNSNITPFIDAVPDTNFDSLNNSVIYSPTSLAGDENPLEVFQDLRHTSTPKQNIILYDPPKVENSHARKRIKFSDGNGITGKSTSCLVLHDITSQNILSSGSQSFIKITDTPSYKKKSLDIKKSETPVIRKVSILRGNNRKSCEKINLTCVESARKSLVKDFFCPDRNPSVRERDKWLYYSGFTNYDLMYKVLSHISAPPDEGLSQFQIVIMTLMKLKCDFDLVDLSHRFQIFVPAVYNLFHSTLSLLYYSLSDIIPWTLPNCPSRSNRTIFLYPLPFRSGDCLKNIFVFITDSRWPILYVSDPLPASQEALSLIPSLSNYFISNDQICIKGISLKNDPTFLKITKTDRIKYNFVESKNCSSKIKFLRFCQETVRSMRNYKLLLSKVPFTDENMKQIVSVVCCLININSSEHISESMLKNIHLRSYRAPRVKQPQT